MNADNAASSDNQQSEPRGQDNRATLLRVYGLYLAAAVVLTWPVAFRIGRDLPGGGPGDPQMFIWNIWWLKFSLFRLHENPLWCSYVAWPFGCSFAFHTNIILYGLIAAALSLFGIGIAASVALLFLNSFALTGLGTYLWCREFGASRRGAFVGGFIVTFSIYHFGRGMCHYNLLATELLPFFWLALKRAIERGRLKFFVYAGLLLLLTFWQDIQLFLFAGLLAVFYLVSAAFVQTRRFVEASTWKGLVVAAAIFFVGSLPYWLAVAPLLLAGEYTVREGSPATVADALSFFVPWPHHWLLGQWTRGVYRAFHFPDIETAYIGYVSLVLAAIGLRIGWAKQRRIGWLAVAAFAFFLLSFGETLQIAGRTEFEVFGSRHSVLLPGALLKHIPGFRQFRVFSRFIFLTVFAIAVPAAMAADWLEDRVRTPRAKRWLVPALLAAITLEIAPLPYLTHPYLLSSYAPFSLLEVIRKDPEPATVFTVPPTIYQPQEQYFQMFHEKPIYGGSLARRPDFLLRRFYGLPAIGDFFWERQSHLNESAARETLTPEFVERFLEMHNIKYLISAPAPKLTVLKELIESRFPIVRQWYEKNFILYELERPPVGRPLHIDLSRHWGFLYLGRGFWPPCDLGAWAVRHEAELELPIRGTKWKALALEMTPLVYDPSESQTVELLLNDHRLGKVTLKPHLSSYQFAIPAGALDDRPCSTLRFWFRYCLSPHRLGLSEDRRTLAAAVRQLHVLASARDDLPLVSPAARQE